MEEGLLHDSVTDEIASRYLSELKGKYIDTLVLVCTHYPLLRSTVGRLMGPEVTLVNPAYETALELKSFLTEADLLCSGPAEGQEQYLFYVSDLAEKFTSFATSILPGAVKETRQINIEAVSYTHLLLLVLSFLIAGRLGFALMPDVDQGTIAVTVEVRPGLQIEEVDKIISRVEKIIMDEPDRKSCMVTYGGSGLSLGGSSASLTAYLKSDRKLTTKEVVDLSLIHI